MTPYLGFNNFYAPVTPKLLKVTLLEILSLADSKFQGEKK